MTAKPSDSSSTASSSAGAGGPFVLTSTAFADGDAIAREFSCDGANVSPPLKWTGVQAGTAALVLVVDDPDARGFVHWLVLDLPGRDGDLPKSVVPTAASPQRGSQRLRPSRLGRPLPALGHPPLLLHADRPRRSARVGRSSSGRRRPEGARPDDGSREGDPDGHLPPGLRHSHPDRRRPRAFGMKPITAHGGPWRAPLASCAWSTWGNHAETSSGKKRGPLGSRPHQRRVGRVTGAHAPAARRRGNQRSTRARNGANAVDDAEGSDQRPACLCACRSRGAARDLRHHAGPGPCVHGTRLS